MAKTNAQVALEAASRVYGEKGSNTSPQYVLDTADKFLQWLERKS